MWRKPRIRRPGRLAVLLLLCVVLALGGVQAWAWYHWRAAQAELERFHGARAGAHLAACLRVWPSSVAAHLLAARAARLDGDYDEAERQLQECQRLQGEPSDEVALEWALRRAAMGDLKEVDEYLEARAAKDPARAPLIREALVQGYVRMYRVFDAVACLDAWLRQRPDDPRALFLYGEAWRQGGSTRQAVPYYQRVLDLDPGQDEARRRLAFGLVELGRGGEALPHLEYLRRQGSDDAEVLVHLARCQDELGQADEARQTLEGVLAGRPGDGPALRALGQVLLHAGQPAEAERRLHQAAAAMPQDYQVQWSLYQALRQEGKGEEAEAQRARAEHLKDLRERLADLEHRRLPEQPHDPALHCEMGTVLLELGYDELGERWLRSALHEKPDYRPAHAALAGYYERKGDAAQAAEQRRAAQEGH